MRRKSVVFFMLMIVSMGLFSDNARKLKNAWIDAMTINSSLTYSDSGFFIGLGILTKVNYPGVNLYIKGIKTKETENICGKIKFHDDIKKIEIDKKKIYWFQNKKSGEYLILLSFFKYKGVKYLLLDHRNMSGVKTVLYRISKNSIEKVKVIKLSYIKNIGGELYGVDLKYPEKIFILDDNFNVSKAKKLKKKQYLFTDLYKFGKEIYFKKVRFKSNHPGFLSENGKSFFFRGQGDGKFLMEGYIRNQIVTGEERDKIYISYMFPDKPRYPVFVYSKKGKCEKTIYGNIEEYMWIPRGNWFDFGMPNKNMEIVSINRVFPDRGKIFVVIHRKTWGKNDKPKKYIQILSKKGKFLGEKEIKISGYPVFYDREEKVFYSIRDKDFSIREWTLKIKYY